jgi:hypothetical protein
MRLARVADGIASQSMSPNTAASSPVTMPTAMFQYATVANVASPRQR